MSRLVLGTVQFGLKYGINNKRGKPSRQESLEILNCAFEKGIDTFDTAAAYGDAEEILGEFISSKKLQGKVKIISKLLPNLIEENTPEAEQRVEKEVEKTLGRLKINSLEGFLLHTPTNFFNKKIIKGLRNCRERGLIKHFGVSIYEVQHALDIAGSGEIDYIQIPYNIFDQRLERTDFFKIVKERGVTVFARSPFLQGLFCMKEEDIALNLSESKKYFNDLDIILKKYAFNRIEAALLFSYFNRSFDHVVFGVDNVDQLKSDLAIAEIKKENFEGCLKEIRSKFQNIENHIIFPSLWAKK